jgi:hypothetical protein
LKTSGIRGPVSFVFGAAIAVAIVGCGGTAGAQPGTQPAIASSRASVSASVLPSSTTAPTEAEDATPLDPDTVPTVGTAGVTAPNEQPAYATKALDLLATLAVKGRAPMTGYSREQFGQAWADVDHNGCDTRNDILKRDLKSATFKPGTRDCVVLTGTLNEPYTATVINFVRGSATSSAVQIDHVVALGDAWQKGAQQLSVSQRTALANDPLNLLAVDGPANMQKGDGDAATWLPRNKAFRCDYVARQISVKATYQLWVTQAEHDAMASVLGNCAGALAPTSQLAPAAQSVPAPAPVQQPAPAPPPVQPAPVPAPAGVFYANCTAVKAAGMAPLLRGQPGYAAKLDRDGDGIACEK